MPDYSRNLQQYKIERIERQKLNMNEPKRYKDKFEDKHRSITMIGSPIPITRPMMSSRFLSALEGIIEVGDASM